MGNDYVLDRNCSKHRNERLQAPYADWSFERENRAMVWRRMGFSVGYWAEPTLATDSLPVLTRWRTVSESIILLLPSSPFGNLCEPFE